MSVTFRISVLAFIFMAFTCCKQEKKTNELVAHLEAEEPSVELVGDVMSKAKQDILTPDVIINSLMDGNERFVNNELTARDYSKQVKNSAGGQYPEAVILSCLDSRIPVEEIFDRGIGDLFVARVAGNFVNEDMLGSLEFACKVSGSKLIVVLGHNHCGAIRAAVDNVKLGNITSMLEKIQPAVDNVDYDGDKTSANAEYVAKVCESNINNTIDNIKKNSSILKEMEDAGEIKIIGAIYNIENGKVDWLD
ncbi:carbonic anhydrase family protein [Aequorivita sp. KMM 9714]|uniref:carbonic anhydrase family protein n=1 Tax=Aequorivita sp. KMM 9714 TaxID=2707173 RepID=UPI0013EC2B25|nr:carbonic anhydrase family protein [Aequorivita sp. KMM 9714]NGX84038.1 carbonic anhydrase [Aequorivita sp. KMM 9714]